MSGGYAECSPHCSSLNIGMEEHHGNVDVLPLTMKARRAGCKKVEVMHRGDTHKKCGT